MSLPTFSQIVQSMLSFLQISRPDINSNSGTVVNDVVVSTVANALSAQNGTDPSVYSSLQYTQNLQDFVVNAASILPADLDNIALNYGMIRNSGTQAIGFLTLRIRNYTTSSPIITVPSGTTVSTLSTSYAPAVSFATTSTITFTPSNAPSYYNPVSGFYEQTVGIICQTIGTVGNVGANTIVSLVGPGLGIDAVTNQAATSGGTNIESNVQFAARIQIKLEGNNVGTPNGIISLMETNPNVIQALIVGPNDPNPPLRNQYGGSTNVYIRGQFPVTITAETFTYSATGSQQYILLNQPVSSVGSVTGIVGGVPYTFVVGTDYNAVINPNLLFAGSTEAASYIVFNVSTYFTILNVVDLTHLQVNTTTGMNPGDTIVQGTFSTTIVAVNNPSLNYIQVGSTAGFGTGSATFSGFKPDNNTVVTVNYTYNSLIATLQALINNNSNHIVGSDILVVEAIEALINFTAGIFIVPGYVPATVVTNVQTALSIYINALGLGANIVLSELVAIAQDVPGVSEVDLTSLILQSTENGVTTTIPPGQLIAVGNEAYPVTNSLTITVEG